MLVQRGVAKAYAAPLTLLLFSVHSCLLVEELSPLPSAVHTEDTIMPWYFLLTIFLFLLSLRPLHYAYS